MVKLTTLRSLSVSKNPLARERPRLPLTRELSPKATEGEKMLQFYLYFGRTQKLSGFLSPSQLR